MDETENAIQDSSRLIERLITEGNYKDAFFAAQKLLNTVRKLYGDNNVYFAQALAIQARLYQGLREYKTAESLYLQALQIFRNTVGENHADFGLLLNSLATVYYLTGNTAKAESLLLRALSITKNTAGENPFNYLYCLINLAGRYFSSGLYDKAEPLYLEARQILENTHTERDPLYARTLEDLGIIYKIRGDYQRAEPYLQKALLIREITQGMEHPDRALTLNSLAGLYRSMGAYEKAEPRYLEALQIVRKNHGTDNQLYASILDNVGLLYESTGAFEKAESSHLQAMKIFKKILGENHQDYGICLMNLALLYETVEYFEKSESLYLESRKIIQKTLGKNHPAYAYVLDNFGRLYMHMGLCSKAGPLLLEASKIFRKRLGENNQDFAINISSLGTFYCSMGDYKKAEPLYLEALETFKKTLGENHQLCAAALSNLAGVNIATRRIDEGRLLLKEVARIDDMLIGQVFSLGSEEQRLNYLSMVRHHVDATLALVVQHFSDSPEVIRDALSLVLKRKAITSEALAIQRDTILGGKYPHLQAKLADLTMLRRQIAQKTLAGPGAEGIQAHVQHLAEQNAARERLEKDLAQEIPEIKLDESLRNADTTVIARTLPPNSALIEFFRFSDHDFTAIPGKGEKPWKPARYCAFVMHSEAPDSISLLDLGNADQIDQTISLYKSKITGDGRGVPSAVSPAPPQKARDGFLSRLFPKWIREGDEISSHDTVKCNEKTSGKSSNIGLEIYSALFAPLKEALGDCTQILVAPDGQISTIPFEIFPTPDGGYLIDQYRISYVGVGRDILRFTTALPVNPGNSLIMASPDFDLQAGQGQETRDTSTVPGRMSRDFSRSSLHFSPLPGTKTEGEQIGALLGVRPLVEATALEARLKSAASPLILHIATHGFFQNDREIPSPDSLARDFGTGLQRLAGPLMENPMLRSGIALAGANTWLENGNLPPDAEDGILTAEDVTGLDLTGTSLAVLSACETGLGDVKTGEGVFGLRRAFALAGAKTLIMSLWKVPDAPTQELMVDFYKRLLAGTPKAEALREAQLEIRKKYPHPQDWGAFICQGDPGPVSGIK